jgi:hypothetical protein
MNDVLVCREVVVGAGFVSAAPGAIAAYRKAQEEEEEKEKEKKGPKL